MPEISPAQLAGTFLIQTLIYVFFCLSLSRALMTVRESNRTIQPGPIWLLLIPVFQIFWNFRVVSAMASSLHKEFTERNFDIEQHPGLTYGMAYAVISIVNAGLVIMFPSLFIAAGFLNLVGLVFFVLYWMKINWYRKVLESDQSDPENSDQ